MFTNKSRTDRKYAVLPTNLVRLFGEICGHHDLDEQIYQVLAEDATFRLNELLVQSENLKIKLNKEKLDVSEVNLVLKCQNVKPIDGLESSKKSRLRSVFDEEEKPIDLIVETNRLLNNKQHVRLRSLKISSEYVDLDDRNLNESIEHTSLPEQSRKYYYFIIKHLFTPNNELFEKILRDLSSNEQLGDLNHHLINHLIQTFEHISKDSNSLMKLILIVESVVRNKHLEFKLQQSLIRLIDLSLDCLLNDALKFSSDFLHKFRYCSAKMLRSILIKFHCSITNSQYEILIQLLNLLLNHFIQSVHLDIKYGIMIFFQHINPFIFFQLLFPYLIEFVTTLDKKSTNQTISLDEQKIFDSTLDVLVSCFNHVINSNRIRNSNEFDVNQYYLQITDVYGDTFTNRIASNDANFITLIPRKID